MDVDTDTDVDRARTRVRAEREAIDAKLDAYESFVGRVTQLQPDRTPSSAAGVPVAGGTHRSADASGGDRCRTVRTAFAETVRPHSVADVDGTEPLLETIREEFTDAVAAALAPTTETSFTPELKQLVLAEARSRRSEMSALRAALDEERAQLDEAADAVDDVVAWLVDADETPLTDLGFDALARRHEALAGHRDRCADLVRERQAFLRGQTSGGSEASVRHRRLVPYLYQELSVDHPLLATVARLDATCRACQRTVRAHIVRRA